MKGRAPGLENVDLGSIPMDGDYVVGRAPLRHVRTLKSPSARARARTWYDLLRVRNTLTYPARQALAALAMAVGGVLTVATVLVVLSLMAGRGRGRAGGDAPAAAGRGRGRGGRPPTNTNPAGPPGPIPEQPPAWTGVRWPEDSPGEGGSDVYHVDVEGAPQGPPPPGGADGAGPAHHGAQEGQREDPVAAQAPADQHQGPDRQQWGPADPGAGGAGAFFHGNQRAAAGGVPLYNGQPQVTPTKVAQRKAARAGDAATFAETDEKDARQTATVYLMAALGDGRSVPRVVAHDDTARRLGGQLREGRESAHGAADAATINETRAYMFSRLEAANHARATAQSEEDGAAAFSLTFSPAMDVALCESDRWTSAQQTLRKRRAEPQTAWTRSQRRIRWSCSGHKPAHARRKRSARRRWQHRQRRRRRPQKNTQQRRRCNGNATTGARRSSAARSSSASAQHRRH